MINIHAICPYCGFMADDIHKFSVYYFCVCNTLLRMDKGYLHKLTELEATKLVLANVNYRRGFSFSKGRSPARSKKTE